MLMRWCVVLPPTRAHLRRQEDHQHCIVVGGGGGGGGVVVWWWWWWWWWWCGGGGARCRDRVVRGLRSLAVGGRKWMIIGWCVQHCRFLQYVFGRTSRHALPSYAGSPSLSLVSRVAPSGFRFLLLSLRYYVDAFVCGWLVVVARPENQFDSIPTSQIPRGSVIKPPIVSEVCVCVRAVYVCLRVSLRACLSVSVCQSVCLCLSVCASECVCAQAGKSTVSVSARLLCVCLWACASDSVCTCMCVSWCATQWLELVPTARQQLACSPRRTEPSIPLRPAY
jgi:hypothetical protein